MVLTHEYKEREKLEGEEQYIFHFYQYLKKNQTKNWDASIPFWFWLNLDMEIA